MSDLHKFHISLVDAYSQRVDRLEVLVKQLQAEVFDGEPVVPESLQAVTAFLDDEIRDTKAEADRLFRIEVERPDGVSV